MLLMQSVRNVIIGWDAWVLGGWAGALYLPPGGPPATQSATSRFDLPRRCFIGAYSRHPFTLADETGTGALGCLCTLAVRTTSAIGWRTGLRHGLMFPRRPNSVSNNGNLLTERSSLSTRLPPLIMRDLTIWSPPAPLCVLSVQRSPCCSFYPCDV